LSINNELRKGVIIVSLDKQIEQKKEDLSKSININGTTHNHTIKISQQLDILIVQEMKLNA